MARRGLRTWLLPAVAAGVRERGGRSFLHVLTSNAIRLYEYLGFRLRLRTGTVS
ncbi:GNAT family N-acetyltransferase [Pseudonocardia alaniniphila]|uniref:GNAT family N-acetyltransferase n=1 Tax=Pseudonocardia alaniniphila TaxID=75291 RepID=A0ABS9TU95_9PSEU|nr:GNAT family N-acetyltransferase [Pseudonocardia alaniniphila]MCH6172139.1 GNAT family N-acetyltransferase [Pseudonocardia alaniniphila]